MTRTLKATFDGKTLVPSGDTGLIAGQQVDVEIRDAAAEIIPGSAASARRLFEKLRQTPKLDAETLRQFDEAIAEGTQPRAEVAPFFRQMEEERREQAEREGDSLPF